MDIVTNIITFLWGLSEVFLLLKMRSGDADEKGKDKRTLSYLWLVIGFSIFFGIFTAKFSSLPFYTGNFLKILGLVLLISGVVLRLLVVYNLGKYLRLM